LDAASTATDVGALRLAKVAEPLSPEKPGEPVPANGRCWPRKEMTRIRLFPVSAT
jgi:hypothetical protein